MKQFIRRRPTASMVIAVIALVFAITGGAIAAGSISVGDFTKKTKKKTVGVGKLTYVSVQQTYNTNQPGNFDGYKLTAQCPSGTHPLGGGTKLLSPAYNLSNFFLVSDYLSSTGYTSQFFAGTQTQADVVQVTVSCAVSPAVTGAPPSA